MMTSRLHLHFQPLDAALLLKTIIWGSNFTLVKLAVRDIPELPFNSLRLLIASAMFLLAIAVREESYMREHLLMPTFTSFLRVSV